MLLFGTMKESCDEQRKDLKMEINFKNKTELCDYIEQHIKFSLPFYAIEGQDDLLHIATVKDIEKIARDLAKNLAAIPKK